jgi:hypothetical protein
MVLALSGCASMESKKREEALEMSVKAYGSALRWGQFEAAAKYRVPRRPVAERLDPASLEGIRVTAYEIGDQVVSKDQTEVLVSAWISYYHESIGKVRTLQDEQVWWFDARQGRWFLDDDLPDFLRDYERSR